MAAGALATSWNDISPVAVFPASDAAAMVTVAEYEVAGDDSTKDIGGKGTRLCCTTSYGARMLQEIPELTNRLFNLLHELEHHLAPADLTGKRLLYEAHQRLKEISDAAEQGASRLSE